MNENVLANKMNLGNSVTHINDPQAQIRLISTVPKSGTWSQKYFWSLLDSLLAGNEGYDPHREFYKPDFLSCDVFGVAHAFCPGWQEHLPHDLLNKIHETLYPGTRGLNWIQGHFDALGKATDPVRNQNAKIALVYRNPLDQVYSYFRPRWSRKYIEEKHLNWPKIPMPGMLEEAGMISWLFDTPKDTLRAGAINSYCIQLATFVEMQKLCPDQISLFRYEDFFLKRNITFLEMARFLDLDVGGPYFRTCFETALKLSDSSTMSKFEEKAGHGINLEQDVNNGWKDKVHIRSGVPNDWAEIFDQEDVEYVYERMDFYNIPRDLVLFDAS